jgi:DNA-binding XRE family transcriptional regulator
MNALDRTVGRHIQRLRLEAGWSQGEFARLLGVPQSTLCAVENGARNPPASMIVYVCHLIGCTPNDLFWFRGAA